jgi:hypothetical protein
MKFALACTHDEEDTQTANELIANIFDESVYAKKLASIPPGPEATVRPAHARRRHSPTSGSNG